MAEEEKRTPEAPQKRRQFYAGRAFFIAITALIIILFTGGIAYGVQGLTGSGEVSEGEWVDGVREFRILAPQWNFEPAVLKLDPGDQVQFIVTSADIMHGFAINELGINLALSPGADVTRAVTIPPDIDEGTYTMYCSIFCGIGHPYMKGNIIIGDPGFSIGKILPFVATFLMAGMFAAFILVDRRRARCD